MIPGYWSALLLIVAVILFVTGWKPLLAPDVRTGVFACALIVIMALLPLPVWFSVPIDGNAVRIHGAVIVLALYSSWVLWIAGGRSYRGYLFLCAAMLAILWGSVRALYGHDPMFYWFGPELDAPLLAGLLGAAFTASINQQLGMISLGAALGELASAWKNADMKSWQLGSAEWWDGLLIALAAAALLTMVAKAVRRLVTRVGEIVIQQRGGRPSP